jgi:sulfide:quinone oxidoreductase
MGQAKTAAILGAGVGGLVAAARLRRSLPDTHRVVLIDREREHTFQPSLLWLAVGARDSPKIRAPIVRLAGSGVDVILGEIESLDPLTRVVRAGGTDLSADAVIVALGADLAPESVPGLGQGGHNLYTLDGAAGIRNAIARFTGGRVVVLTAAPAYKCPAAPYEAAMLIEHELRRRGVRAQTQLDLYAAEVAPMGVAGPQISAAVTQMVEREGIRYHPEHQVVAVDPAARQLSFSNGATAPFDLLVYVPPHRVPPVVRRAGLAPEGGWVAVDRSTMATKFAGVFAIGDVTSVPLAMGRPLPKAGVFAHRQAEVVAGNLAAEWTGRGARQAFDGYGVCFLEVGDGKAGLGSGDFYAEPTPRVTLRGPSRWWHWSKVLFERRWLRGRF